jgi:hypothetical protein
VIVMKSTDDRVDLLLTKELMKSHWNFLSRTERTFLYWETRKCLRQHFEDCWPEELDKTLMRLISFSLLYHRLLLTEWYAKAGI